MIPGSYYVNKKEPEQNGLVNSMYITDIRDPIEISNIKDMYLVMIFLLALLVFKFIFKIVLSYKKSIVRQYNPPTVPIAVTPVNQVRNV